MPLYAIWDYSGIDKALAVQQAPDGGFVVLGYIEGQGAGQYDIALLKTDKDGNVQ